VAQNKRDGHADKGTAFLMGLTMVRHLFLLFVIVASFPFALIATEPISSRAYLFLPLSEQELQQAVETLTREHLLGDGYVLHSLVLQDPEKDRYAPKVRERKALAIVMNVQSNQNWQVLVAPASKRILKKTRITRGQPSILLKEYTDVAESVRVDPRFAQAMKKRGIDDLTKVFIDVWGPGDLRASKAPKNHRILRTVFYFKGDAVNPYGRPIEGISGIFDVTENKLVELIDTAIVPVAQSSADFLDSQWIFEQAQGNLRAGVHSVGYAPKEDPFTVENGEVRWQGFHFVPAMHQREGLVIADLGFEEGGVNRRILRRGSLSEMVVPYADPDSNWHWRCAFNEGDYGVGLLSHSLFPGVHVPENAHVFDAVFAGNDGNLTRIPRALAVFERDGGILWSHYDINSDNMAARRGKELVVMSMFTVGNYDYSIQWILKQDGTIEVKVLLTGILATKGIDSAKCARCKDLSKPPVVDARGTVVAPHLLAVAHQHFFNFRLDFEIDGEQNAIAEIKATKVAESAENPFANAFLVEEEILKREREGSRSAGGVEGLHWWIFNPNKKNSLGHFSGYVLEPVNLAHPMALPISAALKRAPFLKYPLWVTQFHEAEMHAAGDFPSQNEGDGLPKWVKRNASLYNEDIVVWHSVGITHIPRAEDWPVMPVVQIGFLMRPKGFFERNPALDVISPREEKTKTAAAN